VSDRTVLDADLFPDRSRFVVLLGTLFVALNLRPTIASVSPVLEAIRTDLGLSYATASLLTTIPTLCMGVFAFATVPVARRIGKGRGDTRLDSAHRACDWGAGRR